MSNRLDRARENVSEHMEKILANFNSGCLITVLVRLPTNDEADFMLTNEIELDEVIRMLERMKTRPVR